MNLDLLLWALAGAILLQPVAQRRLLEAARRRLRRRIERERGSRVILLVHREESMSLLGFNLMRFLDVQDSEEIVRAILQTAPDVPIDLVLHTPGGLALPSLQIAKAVSRRKAPVTAFVPHYAMSGGTLIALAADQIVMCEHAVLGPIDPQVGDYPAGSVLRAVARKDDKDIDDDTLILADQAAMAIAQLRRAVAALLAPTMRADIADAVADQLSQGQWTHDYPITPEEAKGMGLPVSTDMPPAILEMMSLYPMPRRATPSVEYGRERERRSKPPAAKRD
ncbi:MAG: SDH family Clp fold serine proteinase [Lysobacteraceae bacterium]